MKSRSKTETSKVIKKIRRIISSQESHWVGDGFPVRTLFSYNDDVEEFSPFLLMDYAGPEQFEPSDHIRGVGEHPHRGFETVTIVYSGEVEHRDSAGGGGLIQDGDVQWMTAASGLVHNEMHSKAFAKAGGRFEMVQLWVNLPKKDKMNPPRYQGLAKAQIPVVTIEHGVARIIAGDLNGVRGPAKAHTLVNLWDLRLSKGGRVELPVPTEQTALVLVLQGSLRLGGGQILTEAELAVMERSGTHIGFEVLEDSKVLFLGGEPIDEPVVGYGPFVMNTREEIQQAFADFQAGKMGHVE